jgi:hypothetical protein
MNNRTVNIFAGTLLVLSAACSSYSPDDRIVGKHRLDVIQILGIPSKELISPNGTLLIYYRGPMAKNTFFVYLSRDDLVERWAQVLDEKNFEKITPGMHQDEVIAVIGETKDKFGLARNRGFVWNYRYINSNCIWFQIEFTSTGSVRSSGYSKPPECRVRGRSP